MIADACALDACAQPDVRGSHRRDRNWYLRSGRLVGVSTSRRNAAAGEIPPRVMNVQDCLHDLEAMHASSSLHAHVLEE
eukprot:364263-Chlamydomonas_euryale.AAC.10